MSFRLIEIGAELGYVINQWSLEVDNRALA